MVFYCRPIFSTKQDPPLNSVKNENNPDEEANQMVSFFLVVRGTSCVDRVELFVKRINGVESVKRDGDSKLEVTGKVDPFKIQEMVKHETNKVVELIFPLVELKGDRDQNKNSKAKFMTRVMPIPENEVAIERTGESVIDLKIKLCCESCNRNFRKILKTKGLEMLTIEAEKDLVSVKGTVDATELRRYIKDKLKKDVEVVNLSKVMAPAEKDNVAANKDRDTGAVDKRYEGKCGGYVKKEVVGPMMKSTVVLKIRLHCDGCIEKIQKQIQKFGGIERVSVTAGEDLVTVIGTMDVQELTSYLKEKCKRDVEVVLVQKKDEAKKILKVMKEDKQIRLPDLRSWRF